MRLLIKATNVHVANINETRDIRHHDCPTSITSFLKVDPYTIFVVENSNFIYFDSLLTLRIDAFSKGYQKKSEKTKLSNIISDNRNRPMENTEETKSTKTSKETQGTR